VQDKRAGDIGRARYMRKNATQSEAIVWEWLRNRRFGRWKFRRQHPVGRYVLDFYCDALRLAIEVDGMVMSRSRMTFARRCWRDRASSSNAYGTTMSSAGRTKHGSD
jgi:very-short-patch-repair endonuclease